MEYVFLVKNNLIDDINSENNPSQYFTLNDLTTHNYDKNNDFSNNDLSSK